MKRSIINASIDWAMDCCKRLGVNLPSFAYWTPDEWDTKPAEETAYLKKVAMGWDVTDYNSNDFWKIGAVLFTLRNGVPTDDSDGRVYCEKFIIMKAGQTLPCHLHYFKTEDIINRAGGTLRVYVWNSTPAWSGYKKDLKGDVHLRIDGVPVVVPAGGYVDIKPGDSIYITPGMYHSFEAVEADGDLIVGEVSRCNDDANDNHFNPYVDFQKIDEDEAVKWQLCGGYKQ